MSLYSEVLKLVRRHDLLAGVRAVVVGLSGGPDSVCLLDLLALMAERGDISAAVHAAHLNHRLRGAESDGDELFARDLAGKRGLAITVAKTDIRAAQAEEGGSVEEAARRERYAFLASVARDVGAEAVAVGHNADDQVETVLHRLIRGSGLKGLRGMQLSRPLGRASRIRLVRPLLRTRRSEILDHLRERGLSFREDASNRDVTFLRNRIRGELLPLLESGYNPAFAESILRLSRLVSDAYDLLCRAAGELAPGCVSGAAIDIKGFRRAHNAVKPLVIDRAVAAAVADVSQFDAKHYAAIIKLALDGEPGSRLDLPGGIAAIRSRDALEFGAAPPDGPAPDIEAPLAVPGDTAVPGAGVVVRAKLFDRAGFDLDAFLATKTRYHEVLDADAVSRRLVLRSRRNGDRFVPLGSSGSKKVGDFLTDLKVPVEERGRVLLVAAEEPVWVVGFRIDERAKVTPNTEHVLTLSVEKTDRISGTAE